MDTNSESYSVKTISNPISVREETKHKFEALLKKASANNRTKFSKSQEKLLKESDLEDTNDVENAGFLPEENLDENKSYIMDKFFNYPTVVNVKQNPPIPKPRTKKLKERRSSVTSQGTYNITSPKILSSQSSNYSNRTFNVEEVGDVVFHETPSKHKQKIIVKQQKNDDSMESVDDINENNQQEEANINKKTSQNERIFKKQDISNSVDILNEISQSKEKNKGKKDETVMVEKEQSINSIESIESLHEHTKKEYKTKKSKTKNRGDDGTTLMDETNEHNNVKKYNYQNLIEIIIHKTDRLEINSLIIHPMVKIHVVDLATGKYFTKSDKTRSVVFFYENKDLEYISPVMTQSYNLREKRTLYPCWEETILLNEDYDYLMDKIDNIIFFFEVRDFIPASQMLNDPKEFATGWHQIAFAFLKPTKDQKCFNFGTCLRLQLYHINYYKVKDTEAQFCPLWFMWKQKKLKKYPATLYVTVKSIKSPNIITETLRSKTPKQQEKTIKFQFNESVEDDNINKNEESINLQRSNPLETNNMQNNESTNDYFWSRRPNEICTNPNKCLAKFQSYDEGCFIMKFSNNGIYLACSIKIEEFYCIIIISVVSLQEINKYSCHQGLIHWIKWSDDDSFLFSASADNTISIYNFKESRFTQVLPHPSFIYSIDESENTIATGCYDTIVRIWLASKDHKKIDLFQELEAHVGYVTSVCFSTNNQLFSADSKGVIIEWIKDENWQLNREIKILELRDVVINGIKLLPKHKRILIHCRDSMIRIMHIKSTCILQRLHGALNNKVQIFSSISPCGHFVATGSEDGHVYIWNIKTGEIESRIFPYQQNNGHLTIHCAQYHPIDNLLAISHYGNNFPILIYGPSEISFNQKETEYCHKIVLKSLNHINGKDKWNFRGILQKMDDVIGSK